MKPTRRTHAPRQQQCQIVTHHLIRRTPFWLPALIHRDPRKSITTWHEAAQICIALAHRSVPPDSANEPPGALPFSNSVSCPPSCWACRAATNLAIPAPTTITDLPVVAFIATTPPAPRSPKHQLHSAGYMRTVVHAIPRLVIYAAHCHQPGRLRSRNSGAQRVCGFRMLPCVALIGAAQKMRTCERKAFSPAAQRRAPSAKITAISGLAHLAPRIIQQPSCLNKSHAVALPTRRVIPKLLKSLKLHAGNSVSLVFPNSSMTKLHRSVLLLVFGLSGATALIYEVVWSRLLQTIFGSTLYSTSTIFAAFLLGFSIGAFVLRNQADTTNKPLVQLALIQFCIGLYGISITTLISAINSVYLSLPSNQFSTLLLFFTVLLPPTILFGAIWPFVNSLLIRQPRMVGSRSAGLYSVSSLGSALGAFASGFLLVPVFGFRTTSTIAGMINIGAGTLLLILAMLPGHDPTDANQHKL